MCPSDIQIHNTTFLHIHLFNLLLLLFPLDLLLIQLFRLLFPIPHKLRLVRIQLRPLIPERVPLLSDQVLEVHHELLNQHVSRRSLSLPEVLLDTVLSLLGVLRDYRRVYDDRAALTAHFVQEHLYALVGSLDYDVFFVTARVFFGFFLRVSVLIIFFIV